MSLLRVLASAGERGFIEALRGRFGRLAPPSPDGMGDDAAALPALSRGARLIATTDALLEGRHFRRGEPPYLLGRKALAVNLSDVAAMGARPRAFLLTLGIPADLPDPYLDRFVAGLAAAAREHDVALVGGDTCASESSLVVSITVLGEAPRGRILRRDGARPGDGIYVGGALGASAAGRALLERGWRALMDRSGRHVTGLRSGGAGAPAAAASAVRRWGPQAVRRHLDPAPRLALGRLLLSKRIASSAIDLSDGLSIDLSRLAEASGTGARLLAPAVPIADAARALGCVLGAGPLDLALHGGEDYELLFTVPPSREPDLARLCRRDPSAVAFVIGRMTGRRRGLVLVGPTRRERPLHPAGFDHFRRPHRGRG